MQAMQTQYDNANASELEFAALCPAGFEEPLADELHGLGARRIRALRGSVSFFGDLACAYRVCLWARLASRVTLVLGRYPVFSMDELYEAVKSFPWEGHVGEAATIAVEARGGNDGVRDMRFATLRVKDAVCDRLRELRGSRPFVDVERPDVRIVATVRQNKTLLSLDLGSSSLIDHGYRVPLRGRAAQGRAGFVREDMAALILSLSGWTKTCRRSARSRLVDPLGTSPVLAVEAACIAADRAPRLARRHWGFTGWLGHDAQAWEQLLREAQSRFDKGRGCGVRVSVACTDPAARAELADMARRAGVEGLLDVQACGPAVMELGEERLSDPVVVCALPDEGVVGLMGDLPARLAAMAALTRGEALAEAPLAALVSTDILRKTLAIEPELACNVINGKDDASILVFPSAAQAARAAALKPAAASEEGAAQVGVEATGKAPALEGAQAAASAPAPQLFHTVELPGDAGSIDVLVAASDQYAARLHKAAKAAAKWARRENVSCYRIYDADLPDYAVSVDLYQGSDITPGRWVVMSEYAAPRGIDPELAQRRLADALAITPRVLGVDPENVFLKVRRRAKGGSQYSERVRQGRTALVEEAGLLFEVNFSDYLDTGLFLDHRIVRSMIEERSRKTRFLNLFAYTGTATCYAAAGDAYQTTTVDMSKTYLAWAQRNMEQNGFCGPMHEYVQADVMPWISEQRRTGNRWDLIYIDPPTFSNSARMHKRGFDVQADHAELIIGASRLLTRTGSILFSCNLRGFEPDVEKLESIGIELEDVTAGTIPRDFERNARIHHCYLAHRFK